MSRSNEIIEITEKYGAHNYHPLPVVLSQAKGVWVSDPEGNRYMDFLSAYSAVNQGHCHPRIVKALQDQVGRLTLTSRAFHNDLLGIFLQELCEYTGYEMALPMNTGAEAVETAMKMARRWGVEKKGIPDGKQEIIACEGNFHGRTITIVSFSTDPDARINYGPYTPGFKIIAYDDPEALEQAITANTVAFLVEPIQGEAGVNVPSPGYLQKVRDICSAHNVLLIADEIQTGFCRTGQRFACDHEKVRPDAMTLGKALGGGLYPVSAVVADRHIMEVFTPGTHGSTFGGNPLACAVAREALKVLEDEDLAPHAETLGQFFRAELQKISCDHLELIRGKGLLNAAVFKQGFEAWDVCVALKDNGLLAKQTHGNIIRFAPPLVISETELQEAISIITQVFEQIK
ncbi:ornithine--oxo-acid transaminase [candidate division CSSED10-310 bacterium]|uniref:ornithine aminotransferase n=1 Tax=candidate division CSSED10-310 bacterium TaxID=2855610 RepID=A0ABV6YX55_UNCC1